MIPLPPRLIFGVAAISLLVHPLASSAQSVARTWNDQILAAIRIDFPDPPVHSRNLFHSSVAMWDAWAAYDSTAVGYIHREDATAGDIEAARHEAISYAAYRVLASRYALSVNSVTTLLALDAHLTSLGYSSAITTTVGPSPAAVGNRVAAAILAFSTGDGSNESTGYDDPTYTPVNDPLIIAFSGTTMNDPNRWQPLAFEFAVTQNGLIADEIQTFLGSHWGDARPFALHRDFDGFLSHDPGTPPQLGGAGDADFKAGNVAVINYSSLLDPDAGTMIDISPGAIGNNTLGTNDGTGHATNPDTGFPYPPNVVNHADFGRVVAEFWADGPDSETPPGHWNTLANEVVEHPDFERRFMGVGPELDPLEWDVKMYFAINASVHDSAVAAWGCKRVYDYVRPISSIRYMGALGQSSDMGGPSYHADGLPLVPGLIEVVTAASAAAGQRHEHLAGDIGEIAIYSWGGEPADPTTQYTGAEWILAEAWLPYQRDTFVTPAFAGYISGHSTFSRAAAEVLTAMTGSPYFPGGIASHSVPAAVPGDSPLDFEFGPIGPVELQWATYYDASDQAGISRLYGGIHVPVDDGPGRIVGSACGIGAWNLAVKYFDGSILDQPILTELVPVPAGGGDVYFQWRQYRGMFYKIQTSPDLGSFTDMAPFVRAGDDKARLIVPSGAPVSPSYYYRAIRTPAP